MGQKFSKRGAVPERHRSQTNKTGGQNPLKEANKRNATRQNTRVHGNHTKQQGKGLFG